MQISLRVAALIAVVNAQVATAQVVAYPQDTTLSRATASVPLGYARAPFPDVTEARFQQLIPATHLPTAPSAITALAFPVGGLGTSFGTDYARLEITVSATRATQLSTTYADNLPAPVVVLNATGQRAWSFQQWNVLQLDRPIAHDGVSALVIDIRKVVRSSEALVVGTGIASNLLGAPPSPRLAQGNFGPAGSGAANRTFADAPGFPPIQIRLQVDTPTIALRSDPNPVGVMFAIGGGVEVRVYGPAQAPYCAIVDTTFHARFELPGVVGAGIVMPRAEFPLRVIDASGSDAINFVLPNDRGLVNQRFTLQAGVAIPNGAPTWTNGAEFVVQDTI
jgi:hypothetical protein